MSKILSIDHKNFSPFLQAGIVLGLMVLFMLVGNVGNEDPLFSWMVVCAMMLFYALLNTVLSLSSEDRTNYWWKSIVGFVFMVFMGSVLAAWSSGLKIDEAGSIKWLFIVFTIGYLVFISIVQLIRLIVTLAQREENNYNRNN